LLFFIIAFPLLWWNEGRAIQTARALQEGERTVIGVAAGPVDPANEGKLVHVMGRATIDETLKDAMFGVSANAIKLRRTVQMYQWTEKSSSQKQENWAEARPPRRLTRMSRPGQKNPWTVQALNSAVDTKTRSCRSSRPNSQRET
jgi:hypothetical protein